MTIIELVLLIPIALFIALLFVGAVIFALS